MKFVVLVKHVPDTAEPRALNAETGLLDRDASDCIPDEINERALECALLAREAGVEAEIVALTVGPEDADKSLRKVMAMGADRAVRITDDHLIGSDLLQTARVIVAAISREQPDVVLAGNRSTDGKGGVLPALIAELLDMPVLPDLDTVEVEGSRVRGTVLSGDERVTIEADSPLVASVTEQSAEARFPSFKGIMQAKKKPLEVLSLGDLGLQAGPAYAPVRTVMVSAQQTPPKQAGTVVVNAENGDGAARLAAFLAEQHLI